MTTDQTGTKDVYRAIAEVTKLVSVEGIAKGRKNQQQGYSFRGIDDVYNALAPMLAKADLCILPRMSERTQTERETAKGGTLFYVTVRADFDFVSARDGSSHTVTTYGEAMDSADKATNKAMSAAYKYACMQAFCIPTEGDNDADATTQFIVRAKPTSEVRREQNSPAEAEAPAGRGFTGGETTVLPEQPKTLRSKLLADKQRIIIDAGIPKGKSKEVLEAYFRGYLGLQVSDALPKQPEVYAEAIMMLDLILLHHGREVVGAELDGQATVTGVNARSGHDTWFRESWDLETNKLAYRVAFEFAFEFPGDLDDYLAANKITMAQPDDVQAFLRFALIDRDFAAYVGAIADQEGIPLSHILSRLETKLDGRLESFALAKIQTEMVKENGAMA